MDNVQHGALRILIGYQARGLFHSGQGILERGRLLHSTIAVKVTLAPHHLKNCSLIPPGTKPLELPVSMGCAPDTSLEEPAHTKQTEETP